jgi:hypothetical protein
MNSAALPRHGNLLNRPGVHGSRKCRGLRKYCFDGRSAVRRVVRSWKSMCGGAACEIIGTVCSSKGDMFDFNDSPLTHVLFAIASSDGERAGRVYYSECHLSTLRLSTPTRHKLTVPHRKPHRWQQPLNALHYPKSHRISPVD